MADVAHVSNAFEARQDFDVPTGAAWSGNLLRAVDGDLSPHALYVHQEPHVRLEPHYHDAAEFQVVVKGGGFLGTEAVRPFSVHFATYQTMYGPVVAGSDGLDYITFRIIYQRGLHYWPEERARMSRGGRRYQALGLAEALPLENLRGAAESSVREIIAPDTQGLAAWLLTLPPGRSATIPDHDAGAGRFVLLLGGEALLDDAAMAQLSVAWLGQAHTAELIAGAGGAQALVMQLPKVALEDASRAPSAA